MGTGLGEPMGPELLRGGGKSPKPDPSGPWSLSQVGSEQRRQPLTEPPGAGMPPSRNLSPTLHRLHSHRVAWPPILNEALCHGALSWGGLGGLTANTGMGGAGIYREHMSSLWEGARLTPSLGRGIQAQPGLLPVPLAHFLSCLTGKCARPLSLSLWPWSSPASPRHPLHPPAVGQLQPPGRLAGAAGPIAV